jgi:hypothetical protein
LVFVVGYHFLQGLLWLRAKDSQIKMNEAVVTYIGSKDGAHARMVHPSRTRYGYVHPSYMLGFPTTTRPISPPMHYGLRHYNCQKIPRNPPAHVARAKLI